jgi:hypothetical protein
MPFDPSRDALVNPGVTECRLPGTKFLRMWLLHHLVMYMDSETRFLFRACILHHFHVELRRGIYAVHRSTGQIMPICSFVIAARLSEKTFEYLCRRYLPKQTIRIILPTPDIICCDNNKSGVQIARQLHSQFSKQFATVGQVEEYTTILNDGAGFGKYSTLEKSAFGLLEEMFPEFLDTDEGGSDDFYSSSVVNGQAVRGKKNNATTMQEKVRHIDSLPHQKLTDPTKFPKKKLNKPRFQNHTHFMLQVGPQKMFVKIRQILRKLSEEQILFFYVCTGPPDVKLLYFRIISETQLLESIETGVGYGVTFPLLKSTQSAISSDIFSYDGSCVKKSHCGQRFFPNRESRAEAISHCTFISKQADFQFRFQAFFKELSVFVTGSMRTRSSIDSQRVGWAGWVPTKLGDRWHAWQITVLLLLTNAVHDKIVREMVKDLFTIFPDPFIICSTPFLFWDFLNCQAKDFTPKSPNFNQQKDGIGKGPNYCYQKTRFIIATTKLLVLRWCVCNISGLPSLPKVQIKYTNTAEDESLLTPIPQAWLQLCQSSCNSLFPSNYDSHFYTNLPGVGLKMRHLCAEAIHCIYVGPAIDCHCIRFFVEMRVIQASMNIEQMSQTIINLLKNNQMAAANEVPATISQSYLQGKNGVDSMKYDQYVSKLFSIARKHDKEQCISGFLMHYGYCGSTQ